MNVLKLKLFQETACYKKPAAFKVGETYPLPPYSTVKGMLHYMLDAKQFIPMQISIQGDFESRIVDYQSHYFFKKRDVAEFPLITDGLAQTYDHQHMTTMPIFMHMLYNVNLIIHIAASEDILAHLQQAFFSGPPISLGRWEDLVRVDEVKYVHLDKLQVGDWLETPYSMYWPVSRPADVSGVPYRLNWKYDIVQGVRKWEKIKVRYVQAGEIIMDDSVWVDDEQLPVIFPKEMEES